MITIFKRSLLSMVAITFMGTYLPAHAQTFQEKLAQLETASDGRLGIAAIDTANNTLLQYRSEERFPMCSTSKVMVVSDTLNQSSKDKTLLQQKITYTAADVVAYSPATENHITTGMTIGELCDAAITLSDDTAMNLLMKKLGGPKAINTYAHSIGDNTFKLDRWEPELNTAIPGDSRDTSTPTAMTKSLQQLVLGNALETSQREQLQTWLKNNTTGDKRIRAGVPAGWAVGDKTGSGDYGTTNDIGVIYPPKCAPIVVTIYFTQHKKDAVAKDKVIADATRILIDEFGKTDQCIKPA